MLTEKILQNLLPFQKKAVEKKLRIIGKYNAVLNASEMGLGKTLESLACIDALSADRVLIICPPSLKFNWEAECFEWLNKNACVLSGMAKQRFTNPFVIVGYPQLLSEDIYTELANTKWDCIIVDESHYIKNRKSKRTTKTFNLLYRQLKMGAKVIFCTGTPITNKPVDLYPICKLFSSLGISNPYFISFWEYAKRYCAAHKGRFGWICDGLSNALELQNMLSLFMVRDLKVLVLDQLPTKRVRVVPIELDSEKAKKYAESTKQMITNDADISKLQLVEHIMTARKTLADLKLKTSLEYIKDVLDTKKKVVVFCWHKDIFKKLMEDLSDYGVVGFAGGVSEADKKIAVDNFQNGEARVFVGNIHSAGVGITLTASDYVIFVEYDWTPANNIQAEDRVHRIGQTSKCQIDYLVAKNSLDWKVIKIINKKNKMISEVLPQAMEG